MLCCHIRGWCHSTVRSTLTDASICNNLHACSCTQPNAGTKDSIYIHKTQTLSKKRAVLYITLCDHHHNTTYTHTNTNPNMPWLNQFTVCRHWCPGSVPDRACDICGGQSGIRANFSLSTPVFHHHHHYTYDPHIFHLSTNEYHLSNWWCGRNAHTHSTALLCKVTNTTTLLKHTQSQIWND